MSENDESVETTEEYKEEVERLFNLLREHEEVSALLKIAHPAKLADIRTYLSDLDELIEIVEQRMELLTIKFEKKQEFEKKLEKLAALCDEIEPQLIEYVAKNNPEKLEELKAMLEYDGKDH